MKTLTLFRAFKEAYDDYIHCAYKTRMRGEGKYSIRVARRIRQVDKLEAALTKRLREQEGELERLREMEKACRQENYDVAVTAYEMCRNAYMLSGKRTEMIIELAHKRDQVVKAEKALKEQTNE